MSEDKIESLLKEDRLFEPPVDFAAAASCKRQTGNAKPKCAAGMNFAWLTKSSRRESHL